MTKAKPYAISKQIVWDAYQKVKANRGAAGVDGQTLAAFEKDLKSNLYKLWNRIPTASSSSATSFTATAGRFALVTRTYGSSNNDVARSLVAVAVSRSNIYCLALVTSKGEVRLRGVELPDFSSGETAIFQKGGATGGAIVHDDTDLALLTERWPTLSDDAKRRIIAIANKRKN